MRFRAAILAAILAGSVTAGAAQDTVDTVDPETAAIVATEIRHQGFRCDAPHSATRDKAASQPDITVWIITCDNATYRVRLIPDMAAQIEEIG